MVVSSALVPGEWSNTSKVNVEDSDEVAKEMESSESVDRCGIPYEKIYKE